MEAHEEIAYWAEPNPIWKISNYRLPDDVMNENHVNEYNLNYIRKKFSKYLHKRNKNRFCEKTPSNCFRVAFINEVFPDAQFLHVLLEMGIR